MTKPVEIKSLTAGDEVRAWCGKCHEMRDHKVKAITPGKAPKCICLTCHAEHLFRRNPPGKTRARKPRQPAPPPPNPWHELVEGVSPEEGTPYSIGGRFGEGQFINHARYGLGKAIEVIDLTKVKVVFEDGLKIMMMNRPT